MRDLINYSITSVSGPVKNHGLIIRLAVIRLAIHLPDEQLVYPLAPLFLLFYPMLHI